MSMKKLITTAAMEKEGRWVEYSIRINNLTWEYCLLLRCTAT